MTTAVYTLWIDWEINGNWEDETANLLSASVSRGFDGPLARMASTGRATFVLSNRARIYSPEYHTHIGPTPTPLNPRQPVKFDMTVSGSAGTLFRGFVESIRPSAGKWGDRTATVECVDATALFDLHEGDMALMRDARADEIIDAVVDAVYTPPGTSYKKGVNVFPVSGDKWGVDMTLGQQSETIRASQKIQDAAASDWGRFFVAKNGYPAFSNRHSVYLCVYAGDDTVYSDFAVTDSDYGDGVEYVREAGQVFNAVDVSMTPRSVGSIAEVIGRAQQRGIKIETSGSQAVSIGFVDAATGGAIGGLDVIAPLAGDDFAATNDEPGEGTDVSASVTVSMTAYSDKAELNFGNTSGSVAYIHNLQVRGLPVRSRAEVTLTASDATSIAAYQKRKLSLNMPMTGSEHEAQRLADYLLACYKDPVGVVRGVRVYANADDTALAWARDVELLQRVIVTEFQTVLEQYSGVIFALRHQIDALNNHIVTVDLEKAVSATITPVKLDLSTFDSGHILIY